MSKLHGGAPKRWVYQKVSRSLQFCHQFLGTPPRINSSNLKISKKSCFGSDDFSLFHGCPYSQVPAVFIFRGVFSIREKIQGQNEANSQCITHGRMPGIPAEGLAA